MKPSLLPILFSVVPALSGFGKAQELDTPPLLDEPGHFPTVPKVSVLETVVSIDGTPRPDLGRSFTDSLIAGLLKDRRVDVIEPATATGTTPPAATPTDAGNRLGIDLLMVPTLVAEQQFFRLSIKKISIPSGRVEAVIEESGSGPLPRIFELAGRAVAQLIPAAPKPTPAVSSIRGWMSSPDDAFEPPPDVPRALPSTQGASPSGGVGAVPPPIEIESKPARVLRTVVTGPRAREIEEIGRVTAANSAYSFCVIDPHRGRTLAPGMWVMIRVKGWVRPTLPATVTRIERGHAIAEFETGNAPPPSVESGARVYEWVPESATTPTPDLPAVLDPLPPAF